MSQATNAARVMLAKGSSGGPAACGEFARQARRVGGEIDEPDRPPALRQRRDEVGDVFGQGVGEADHAVGGEARQRLAGESFCDRADAGDRVASRLVVRTVRAASEAVDRSLAVADDADDERRDLCRKEQDLPGEADRLVEFRLACEGRTRRGQRGCCEKGEDVAAAHGVRREAVRQEDTLVGPAIRPLLLGNPSSWTGGYTTRRDNARAAVASQGVRRAGPFQ